MKLLVRIIVVLILLVGGGGALWYYFAAPAPAAAPVTSEVARGAVEQTVLASGVLEASSLVSVGAEVSGRINAVHVDLGQEVEAGELIAEIDSLNQENAVRAAEAALASAEAQKRIQEANARQAAQALARADQLREQSLISNADYEAAQLAVETAQAQVEQFEAQILQAQLTVDSANLDLARTQITAPTSGTVVAVLVEEGQTVNANSDAPTIAMLANLDTMIVKAEISEADVPRVSPGQRVYFTILGAPDRPIDATLLDVEPAPESITTGSTTSTSEAVYYNGRFEVPNPDGLLRIAMTAEVTIVLDEARDVIVVPAAALVQSPQGTRVRVFDAATETVEMRPVEVGLNNNILAEITSGLAEGERIVEGGMMMGAGRGGFPGGAGGGGPGMMMRPF